MKRFKVALLTGVVLVGCGSGADVPPDQTMDSQVKGLQNGPAGGKGSSKSGGVTKVDPNKGKPAG